MQSPEILRGIEELDNFGFRMNVVQMDPTRTCVITGRRHQTGFHVSDLWSQKQQQEFLKRLRLERAQFARERQVSFVNYLIQNKKRLVKNLEPDSLTSRYSQACDPLPQIRTFDRLPNFHSTPYISSTRSLSDFQVDTPGISQSHVSSDKLTSPTSKNRLFKVQGLITHCDTTLVGMKKASKELKTLKVKKKRNPVFKSESGDAWELRRGRITGPRPTF